jgi:uncharacterized protein (DUF3820 family)
MADSMGRIPFGNFKGIDIEDVPDSYLRWIIGEDWFKEKFSTLCIVIKKELKFRSDFDQPIKDERIRNGRTN